MPDEQKPSLISQTLITQIEGFIQRNGRDHDAFVVGITDDLEAAYTRHGINRDKHVHFTVNALTDERAENVIEFFRKKGCTIGDEAPSGIVYCYRRAFNTSP